MPIITEVTDAIMKMSIEDLMAVRKCVTHRHEALSNEKRYSFRSGTRVEWVGPKSGYNKGTIKRRNPKTATIDADGNGEWRVPYHMLTAIGAEA